MTAYINALLNPEVPFIRYAFFAGIISSIPFGIIGSFVVVKKMSYVAGALSHAVLGGIGITIYLNTALHLTFITPITGAFVFSVLSGLIITFAVIYGRERIDTIIGTIWAVGMSLGLLFIYISPDYTDPMSYLFGNILLITKNDLVIISVLNIIITFLSIAFYNQFLSIAFDMEFSQIKGLNVPLFQLILILMISLTVLLMITIIGIVMVIALLTIPPAIAGLFTKRLKNMIIFSIIICFLFTITGLVTSYYFKLPTSSVTVVFAGFFYIISLTIKKFFYRETIKKTSADK